MSLRDVRDHDVRVRRADRSPQRPDDAWGAPELPSASCVHERDAGAERRRRGDRRTVLEEDAVATDVAGRVAQQREQDGSAPARLSGMRDVQDAAQVGQAFCSAAYE